MDLLYQNGATILRVHDVKVGCVELYKNKKMKYLSLTVLFLCFLVQIKKLFCCQNQMLP
jgi:hypothetical protein